MITFKMNVPKVSPANSTDVATTKVVDVVVGVLCNPQGELLFAQRPAGKPMAGYWEFPGGKIEANESHQQALTRELQEEIGVTIENGAPWSIFIPTRMCACTLSS